MLSCINGMVEWYRTSGNPRLLQAALNAWKDITAKRLDITSTTYQVWLPLRKGTP
jgi:hypothetical protein